MSNNIDLKELQKIEVDILKSVHEICKNNGIKYSLFAGTAIGAARHKGFIPWDDDIDICMLREDYDKFIKIVKKEKNYMLLTNELDKNYPYPYAKMVDRRTIIKEVGIIKIKNYGVFVDIFPIDSYPNSKFKRYVFRKKLSILMNILRIKQYEEIISPSKKKKILKRIIRVLIKHIKIKTLINAFEKTAIKYANSKNSNYCGSPVDNAMSNYNAIFEKKIFEEFENISFENNKFLIIKNYDEMLQKQYGNYMKMPPKEKRVSEHHFEYIKWK